MFIPEVIRNRKQKGPDQPDRSRKNNRCSHMHTLNCRILCSNIQFRQQFYDHLTVNGVQIRNHTTNRSGPRKMRIPKLMRYRG